MQKIVRGLTAGSDPARLLHDCLSAAIDATAGRQGLLVGLVDGIAAPLASSGAIPTAVVDAANAAADTGRLTRKTDHATGTHALAQPLRIGGRVVGALAVGGSLDSLDPGPLPFLADFAALVLARRPAAAALDATSILDAASRVALEVTTAGVLSAAFDEISAIFNIHAGFCALVDPTGRRVVVAHERNVDRDRLRQAGTQPGFRPLITSVAPRVETAANPVVAQLTDGAEVAVSLPLRYGHSRLGQLVLLTGESPDDVHLKALGSFAGHIATALRAADLRQEMADRDEQLETVVHSVLDPVVVVDAVGHIVTINGAAAEAFRLAGSFEAGQPVQGRLGHAELEASLVEGSERSGWFEVVLGVGSAQRSYRASTRAFRAADGNLRGRVLVLDDVTEARAAEQIKADFIAVIGHELRTPLTVMKGYLGALARTDRLTEERQKAAVNALSTNTNRLENLIEDLLMVSSLETGRTRTEVDPAELGEVLDPFATDRVTVKKPRRPIEMEVDGPKLRTVLRHLVDNALKYSSGSVEIVAATKGEAVTITVSDDGEGIFSGDLDRLFDRFTQLDGSSTRAQGGTGTGLYICRRLVEAMDGHIECDTRLGQGTRMVVTLPLLAAADDGVFDEITFARS